MPALSKFSLDNLNTCTPFIQSTVKIVAAQYDVRVICGRRSWDEQRRLLAEGKTKVGPGKSKHNSPIEHDTEFLSRAVDIVPYPIDWRDSKRFVYLAGLMIATARMLGGELRWGGNWDRDQVIIDDQNFDDLPHFEEVPNLQIWNV